MSQSLDPLILLILVIILKILYLIVLNDYFIKIIYMLNDLRNYSHYLDIYFINLILFVI